MPGIRQSAIAAVALACAVAAFALGGCGGGEESGLARLAPPDTPLYMEAAIFPDDERSEAIAELSSRIGGIDDPEAALTATLDDQLEAEGTPFTYAEDIEPWLGEATAFFVRSFEPASVTGDTVDAALLVETTDEEAAQAFVDRLAEESDDGEVEARTYDDVDYRLDPSEDSATGLVDGSLVVGTEASFKAAVDAVGGNSLAGVETFADQVGELDDDRLAELWLDLGTTLDAAAGRSGADNGEVDAARSALGPLLSEPVALWVDATGEAVSVEASTAGSFPFAGNSELLGQVPTDAWFALAIEDAGAAIGQSLDGLGALGSELGNPMLDPEAIAGAIEASTGLDLRDDILDWIGDTALFVSGTSETSFRLGAVLEATDRAAAAETIEAARDLLEERTGASAQEPRLEEAEEGFSATAPTGAGLEVALRDDAVIVAFGGSNPARDAFEPQEPLSDATSFGAAIEELGDDFAATAYVAIQDFLVVAEQGDEGDTDYEAARPYTRALSYLILGTRVDDDRELTRVVVGVEE